MSVALMPFAYMDSLILEINLADQILGDSNVRGIASRRHDRNRIAESVYIGVDLGAFAVAAHSNTLIDLGFLPRSVRISAGVL